MERGKQGEEIRKCKQNREKIGKSSSRDNVLKQTACVEENILIRIKQDTRELSDIINM